MNRAIVSVAGAGKTTLIVSEILKDLSKKTLVMTYTNNNLHEIKNKFHERGMIPSHVNISTWFSFLLRDMVRPYQNFVTPKRVNGVQFVEGRSAQYIKKTNVEKYFFNNDKMVYADKISELALECDRLSGGLVMSRLESLYDRIYLDEVQDMAGYDLEVLEMIMKSKIRVTLVGDHRQATYQTNYSPKNKAYSGAKVVNKFIEWNKKKVLSLQYNQTSHRCNQDICNLGDSLYPEYPKSISSNTEVTGHDGVFIVTHDKLKDYLDSYSPKILRYDRRTKCSGYEEIALNWGDSKGLTFDRILIIPHGPLLKFLTSGDVRHVSGSLAKLYVAITRARYSVAFLMDKTSALNNVKYY